MCYLRYEHEFYVQSRKRFPKEGRLIKTKRGEEKVIANDIFRERVMLRGEDGEQRTIALDELRAEAEAAGAPLPVAVATPAPPVAEEAADEELVLDEPVRIESAEPPQSAAEPAGAEESGEARERRPHRRRGRRGGRRNRPGGRSAGESAAGDADGSNGENDGGDA
jgi:hypothetical protein